MTLPELKRIARIEGVEADYLKENIRRGRIVVPNNKKRKIAKPCAIGAGLRTKVNANIGASPDSPGLGEELKKLEASIKAGADTVMDLSVSGNLKKIRKAIIGESCIPVGTVPVYEAAVETCRRNKAIKDIDPALFLDVLRQQAQDGVDFFTIHAGVTRGAIERLKRQGRLLNIVSRGGAILTEWMLANNKENPYYEKFDEVLNISKRFNITLSLGDGLRPGAIQDATDRGQIQELIILGELAKKAREAGVYAMIEGPGHIPLDQIETNIKLQKSLCDGAPFYVLGPLVTDIAPGYDHITSAIGGAIAASCGADFLCYVTPSEHLRLPTTEDVEAGVIASRIAAHAADIVKTAPGAAEWDKRMSAARKERNWKKQFNLALDPKRPRMLRKNSKPYAEDVCTMCSKYCSIKIMERHMK